MIEVVYDRGTFLPSCDLWLDPQGTRPFAFISHAHSTQSVHGGHHQRAILTEATARLMRARLGFGGKVQHVLRFGEKRDFGSFVATLIPGGYVLGSAQILVEQSGENLLYAGDFKLRRDPEYDPIGSVRINTLVMEAFYGHPSFKFPPRDKTLKRIIIFCQEALTAGMVPVLLGFSLGKAKEILAALAEAKLPIMLHGSIWPMMRLYEGLGEIFPPYSSFEPSSVPGHVLLSPIGTAQSPMMEQIPAKRVAIITGRKVDKKAKIRYQCDEVFPLSDHADYSELMGFVQSVKPSRVFTLHGFAPEFSRDLRVQGIESWALTGGNQMDLSF